MSEFFRRLGAPLVTVYRWGAISPSDGTVFLRVWQDEIRKHDDACYVRVAAHEKFRGDPNNVGWKERLEHIDLVRAGRKCYLVMCTARDVNKNPRNVEDWNEDSLFVGGPVIELDGDSYVRLGERVPPSATHS